MNRLFPRSAVLGLITMAFLGVATGAQGDASEPNDTPEQATPLVPGILTARSISPSNDIDWYRFSLAQAAKVTVSTVYDSLSGEITFLQLFRVGEGGALDTGFFELIRVLTPGDYFLRVEEDRDSEIPSYDLSFSVLSAVPDPYEPDNTAETATPLLFGTPQGGHTIAPVLDVDWFSFTLSQRTSLVLETSTTSGTLRVTVFDGYNQEVSSARTRLYLNDLAAGAYRARIEEDGNDDITAAYTVRLWDQNGPDIYEDNDTPDRASWMGVNGPKQSHNFHDEGDQDWIGYYAVQGDETNIEITPVGVDANPVVRLFRGDGVTEVDLQGSTFWQADATGFYFLQVTNDPATALGPGTVYRIGVPRFPPGILPGALVGVVSSSAKGPAVVNALVDLGFGNVTARTDERGIYVFPALPPDSYTLTVNADGYLPSTPFSVDVGSGSTVQDVQLARAIPTLTVTPPLLEVGAAGGEDPVSVRNTGAGTLTWNATVTLGGEWLSIRTAKITGNGTIHVTYAANTAAAPRNGTIRVEATGAVGSPVDVTVTQAAARRPSDINGSGGTDATDVQLVINAALGLDIGGLDADINDDNAVNASDVQLVINAALGLG